MQAQSSTGGSAGPAQRTYAQGKYWLLTVPVHLFIPHLPLGVKAIKGQLEIGSETGYRHWQLVVCFELKCRLRKVKEIFGDEIHAELSRSPAANLYVWKEDTAVAQTRFQLGTFPLSKANKDDWEQIWQAAKEGHLDAIPPDVRLRYFGAILRVHQQYLAPVAIERTAVVYWGSTGVGKSRRAWSEAGILDAYPKDPRSKFWDGYRGQLHVVIDEFRGGIDIAHLLRWLDRYPVIVEVKGSSTICRVAKYWITSNLHPRDWYPGLDSETYLALERRLEIVHME